MNILYINHYAGGPTYGMEYRPYYLAREWVRAGHQVTIVAASQSHVRSKQPAMRGRFTLESIEGIKYVWCRTPTYRGNGVGRVLNIMTFLRRLCQWREWLEDEPHVVIASSTYPADIGPARRLARRFGSKLVWEVHDLWPLSPIELGGMSHHHPFVLWMQRAEDQACREADIVVSMLPKADGHLREHGMQAAKFLYIPNGIDPDEWRDESPVELAAAHTAAIQAARDRGHLLVAYAGAHGVANALGAALNAAALLRDEVTWLFIGDGPEKAALQRRVLSEQLTNVVMLDAVPRKTIPTLLRAMDVLFIGLQNEPLFRFGISPNKLMDYMMSARPIVCAISAGNDPVSESGCGTTVPGESPEAIVGALRRIASMTADERHAMGQRGRGFVLRHHTFPVLARRFIEAIEVA